MVANYSEPHPHDRSAKSVLPSAGLLKRLDEISDVSARLERLNLIAVALSLINAALLPFIGIHSADPFSFVMPISVATTYVVFSSVLLFALVVILLLIDRNRRRGDVLYDAISDEMSKAATDLSSTPGVDAGRQAAEKELIFEAGIYLKSYAKSLEVPIVGARHGGLAMIVMFVATTAVNILLLRGSL